MTDRGNTDCSSMRVEVVEGDLLDQDVEVIVNAWNRNVIPWWLLLPRGVSGAIKRRGGTRPFKGKRFSNDTLNRRSTPSVETRVVSLIRCRSPLKPQGPPLQKTVVFPESKTAVYLVKRLPDRRLLCTLC